ncbi:MAG: LysR family transcriptional regulator [Pseudomonadota bacterium]
MNWDDLRTVLAIARAGSLVGAAERLGVSHPTVFRRLGALEARLGVRLFERARSGTTATPAGEEMAAQAAELEERVGTLERRLLGRDLRPAGTLRVTTTDTLLYGLLAPILAQFRAAHPEIELEIALSNEPFNLSKRDSDVAIRPTTRPPEPLVGRKVSAIALAVYGVRVREPEDLPWIGLDDSLSGLPLARWLAARNHPAPLRLNSLYACCEAARAGLGRTLLPCFLGDPAPELVRLGAPIDELEGELWLLTHPDLRKVARVRVFLDFTAEAIVARRGLLEADATPPNGASAVP